MSTVAHPEAGIEQLLHAENELLPPKSLIENARLKDYAAEYQRSVDDPALLIADRRSGPLGEKGTVVVEHCRVHVGGDQRLTSHRQRRAVWRMGVHDGVHVGSMPINPKVKAVRRIYHTVAGEQVEIVVRPARDCWHAPRRSRGQSSASNRCQAARRAL